MASTESRGADSRGNEEEEIIFVGIDFGTTYSGVAWAYSDVEKVPTQLGLGNDYEAVTWGFGISDEKEAIKWFKLHLLEDKDVPEHVRMSPHFNETKASLLSHKKNATELVACFLENIWNHSISSIERTIGAKLISTCRFHIIITVPAIWPPYAQQRMKKAAWMSGIVGNRPAGATTLQFISEPEAAAMATIEDLSKRSTIEVGDTLVVCDAGGGTVDLISYSVESVEPFAVKECVKGDGALCGGVCPDEKFIELIKSKVTTSQWKKVHISNLKKFLNEYWEHGIKPQFRNQDRIWSMELPEGCNMKTEPNSRKRTRHTELTSGEIKSVFKSSVEQIENLVRAQADEITHQLQEEPTYIVLVGGFGRSPYVFERLSTLAGSYGATILQSRGTKPWTAICRGAVIQGLTSRQLSPNLNVEVKSRIARHNYGIKLRQAFDPKKHDVRDKAWDERERCWEAKNQMEWLLKQGEVMTDHKPVSFGCYRILDGDPGTLTEDLYISSAQNPSTRAMDSSVSHLCAVEWDHKIQLGTLPKWTSPLGKVFRKLNFTVEMKFDCGIVEFTISHNGMQVAEHNLQVEFDYV